MIKFNCSLNIIETNGRFLVASLIACVNSNRFLISSLAHQEACLERATAVSERVTSTCSVDSVLLFGFVVLVCLLFVSPGGGGSATLPMDCFYAVPCPSSLCLFGSGLSGVFGKNYSVIHFPVGCVSSSDLTSLITTVL